MKYVVPRDQTVTQISVAGQQFDVEKGTCELGNAAKLPDTLADQLGHLGHLYQVFAVKAPAPAAPKAEEPKAEEPGEDEEAKAEADAKLSAAARAAQQRRR